jgi:hypothetical protein
MPRPARQEAEEVAEVGVRLEAEHLAARDERYEGGVGVGAVVAADEQPVPTAHDLAAQVELADG